MILQLEYKTIISLCLVFIRPVHGGFSEWTLWGACNEICGGGRRNRTRQCNSPLPQNDGNNCVGELLNEEQCSVQFCPGNTLLTLVDGLY